MMVAIIMGENFTDLITTKKAAEESYKNNFQTTAIIKNKIKTAPAQFRLYQNYPNPFNPVTRIKYDLPFKARVKICIFNNMGQLVEEIENDLKTAGSYQVQWNAANLASGIYFYRLTAGGYSEERKMLLIK